MKTDCPLCRFDFTEKINEFFNRKSKDIVQDAARVAVEESSNNPLMVRSGSENGED